MLNALVESLYSGLTKTVFGIDETLSLVSDKIDSETRKNAQLKSEWGVTRDPTKLETIGTGNHSMNYVIIFFASFSILYYQLWNIFVTKNEKKNCCKKLPIGCTEVL